MLVGISRRLLPLVTFIAFLMARGAHAGNPAQSSGTQTGDEDQVLPLLSLDSPGMMLLAKARGAKNVLVKGTLVDDGGAPLAGKTVCSIVADGGGITGILAGLTGGYLTAVTAKSNATGGFQLTIPRFVRFAVCPCAVKGITVKLLWKTPILKELDATKTSIDLGKVAPSK